MTTNELVSFFQRALAPLKSRVQLMVGKCVIAAVNDTTAIQELQIKALAGEAMNRVPRVQEFGFASNPPVGSEAIVVALGGNRENLVVIATDKRSVRFKNLASGECAIYTDDGSYIVLKKAGEIEVKAATKLTVDVPYSEFKGNVKIEGTLEVDLDTTIHMNLQVDLEANATVGMGAGYYSGPLGGAPQPVVIPVPVQAMETIDAAQDITSNANVIGGGTDMVSIKSTFNAHTHPENDVGGNTDPTTTPL